MTSDDPLRIGLELEFPTREPGREPLADRAVPPGTGTTQVNEILGHDNYLPHGGALTHEHIGGSEYGLEARTPANGLPPREVPEWYAETIRFVEEQFDVAFEPTSFYGDTTAGLHTHISPLGYDGAQRLYELSQQPFMWVFCGSAVAPGGSPVIRENAEHYVTFYDDWTPENSRHRAVVNARDAGRHYEWRLPEPMTPEHVELLCQFIERFHGDFSDGENFARGLVENGDPRLTSVQRARQPGVEEHLAGTNEAADLLSEVA